MTYEQLVHEIHDAVYYGNVETARHYHAKLCKMEKWMAHEKAIRNARK